MIMDTFEAPRTIYRLEFDGDEFNGLVVRVRALTFNEWLEERDILAMRWVYDTELTDEERDRKADALHSLFADHLVDWNLCSDGEPVPATLEGLRSQEALFIGQIISAWRNNALGVISRPLEQPSSSGDPLEELQIPMEPLSESLAS